MPKICLVFAALLAACALQINNKPLFSDSTGEIYAYLGNASSQCEMICVSDEGVDGGMINGKKICGYCVMNVDSSYVEQKIKELNAQLVFSERVGDTDTKYYYSTKIPVYKRVNGKKVNLQTAETNGNNTIGSPMIFGGY